MTGLLPVQEMPQEFVRFYSTTLRHKLHLILGDGKIYEARFCRINHLLYGLKILFKEYAFRESFFLFFHYVDPSHLYITVYNELCVDILNGNNNKLLFKDIHKNFYLHQVSLSSTSEVSSGTACCQY